MAVILLRGHRRLPRAQIAVTVDPRAAEFAERRLVLEVHRGLVVGGPAVRTAAERRARDASGARLVIGEQVPLESLVVGRDEEVHVRVGADVAVSAPGELGDIGPVGRLGVAPLRVAAVDRIARLDENVVLAAGHLDASLCRLRPRSLEFVELVVLAVEVEPMAGENADRGRVVGRRIVPARVLEAEQHFAVLEHERAGDLGPASRGREPFEIPTYRRCPWRVGVRRTRRPERSYPDRGRRRRCHQLPPSEFIHAIGSSYRHEVIFYNTYIEKNIGVRGVSRLLEKRTICAIHTQTLPLQTDRDDGDTTIPQPDSKRVSGRSVVEKSAGGSRASRRVAAYSRSRSATCDRTSAARSRTHVQYRSMSSGVVP